MGGITKGFHVHCPDCKFMSRLIKTPAEVRNYVRQHLQFSKGCIKLKQALAAGTYDSPAAFGASSSISKVQPEKVILELMGRLVVMTACHIVSATRPPPTPIDKLSGEARRTAAATAYIRSSSKGESTFEGQQLLPYRMWAVDALSLDSELLTEANWVRPSLAGLALEHKPSLLDLVLAPPYIAVAEHDAGMTVDKLAVLLLREQQQHKISSLHRLATAAAAGGDQLPAAVAAVEAALSELLSADAVFQHTPVQQRVQQFLDLSGIPGLGDVVCALAQPHVAGRGPHNRHLAVCAVCGMTPAALQRAKRSYALHRCKYCIVSICQPCRQEQQEQQQSSSPMEAAAADQLCLWCQGHPDTQDLGVGTLSGGSVSSKDKQQTLNCKLSSPESSTDQAASAEAAAVLWDVKRSSDSSLGTQQQQQQQAVGRLLSTAVAAPAGAADHGDMLASYRSPRDYDIAVELAAAAAAAGARGSHDRQLAVTANSKLQQEMEDLQRLQAELQSAVECLGIQGMHLLPALPLQPQDGSGSKDRPSPCAHDAFTSPSKRLKVEQLTDLPEPSLAAQQTDSATADSALADLLLSSAGFAPLSTASVGECEIHAAASIEQAGETAHMLADAGFTTISPGQCIASQDAVLIGGQRVEAAAGQQQHKGSQAAGEVISSSETILKSLEHQIDLLSADISGWCSSNLAADHAGVDKTLQVLQHLKQQLWHNYQQTGEQLFINGLEILGEIVGAFTALPAAGAKVVLACNSQRRVSGACCPDNQPCSVLELIMCCWFKEMQDSGVTGVGADCKDTATADGGSPRFEHSSDLIKQQQVIRSGQCQAVLRLIAQLSALQYHVYYGPLAAAGAESQHIQAQKDVADALRQAVMYVMSGTALLMLQEPDADSPCSVANSSKSKIRSELAAQWHQCLFECKWAVANKFFNSNDATNTALWLAGVVRRLERIVSKLQALKDSGLV